jgi:high-affinity iron transporter
MFDQLLNQFIVAFREGIEASLIITTIVIALKKRGAKRLTRAAYAGVATSVVACVIAGLVLGSIALVSNPEVEMALYGTAAITVLTMVFWMFRNGKQMRSGINSRIESYSDKNGILPLLGIFFFVFFMVAREGFEMVLLLIAFGAGVGGAYYVSSMLLGLGLAVACGYALSRGLVKINLGKFLQATAVVLLLFVLQLTVDFLHEAFESGFIPEFGGQAFTNFVDWAHDALPIFSYMGLGLFVLLVAYFLAKHFGEIRSGKTAVLLDPAHAKA